jgi:hypothetical protein
MCRINHKKLVSSLNKLCNYLNFHYNINCGGCCFLAYLLAKHFDKLGIKYSLVIFNDYFKDQEDIVKEVTHRQINTIASKSITGKFTCIHYCLQLNRGGIINIGEDASFIYFIKNINSKNICWIYKTGSWNDVYNVSNNKIINNIIKTFFKQYE